MAIKHLILIAFAIRFAYGDSSIVYESPSTFQSDEKNWTVIYTYELDEIVDELTEFKRCVSEFTDLCQSLNDTKKCGTYCGYINKEIGWIETRLNYIKSCDVMGSQQFSIGRKNKFKMETIGETTHIHGELPTNFEEISKLKQKIQVMKQCRKCHMDIDDYRRKISSMSMIQLQKVNEIATALEYLRNNKCEHAFIPIALQRLFSYLIEVEQFIQDQSLYEINVKKIKRVATHMFEASVLNNTFRVVISIPIKLKDCVRQKPTSATSTSSSVFVSAQTSGYFHIKN